MSDPAIEASENAIDDDASDEAPQSPEVEPEDLAEEDTEEKMDQPKNIEELKEV